MRQKTVFVLLVSLILPSILDAQEPSSLDSIRARQPQVHQHETQNQLFIGDEGEFRQDREMTYGEQAEFMRKYCRANQKDSRCLEFPWTDSKAETRNRDVRICAEDPLNKKCFEKNEKVLENTYKADRICNDRPDSKKCRAARDRAQRRK